MLKKSLIFMAFILISQYGFSQNVDKLFSEFSHSPHAETVNLSKFLTSLIKPFSKELKGIDSINVLDMSECPTEVKDNFSKKVKKLKDDKYETLVRSNEDGENTQVLVKIKDEAIRELVVITTGSDCCLVRIKGKFKQSDVASLVND